MFDLLGFSHKVVDELFAIGCTNVVSARPTSAGQEIWVRTFEDGGIFGIGDALRYRHVSVDRSEVCSSLQIPQSAIHDRDELNRPSLSTTVSSACVEGAHPVQAVLQLRYSVHVRGELVGKRSA